MTIWIDLDNSPHVLLFAPIIRELRRYGVECLITVRDFSQTPSLAERHGLQFTMVGRHSHSSSLLRKSVNTLHRAWELRRAVSKHRIAAAVSHGSRASMLAARSLGVPVLTLDDYEFCSLWLINMVSNRVLVPEIIPEDRLKEQGLDLRKLIRYPGLKEEVYVYDFKPDASVLQELKLDPHRVVVTVRPPATWAHYHHALGDLLFRALLNRLNREPGIQVVISARTQAQQQELRNKYDLPSDKFRVYSHAVDGLSLMWFSDVVFSGGGTMVRESALMGVTTYSVFGGRVAAADEYLASKGRLRFLRDPGDIDALVLPTVRGNRVFMPAGRSMAPFIAQEILTFVKENSRTTFQIKSRALNEQEKSEQIPRDRSGALRG